MEVLYPRCAGLDVHKDSVVACVRCVTEPVQKEVRTFGTTTSHLLALADWLTSHGCTHVAMEATGIYWKPVWHILEDRFELVLANAQHIRNVPGRKTDVNDATWIADLLAHGLIRASFVPPTKIQELRDLTRTRKQLVREISQHTLRIQKTLENANIKVASVLSDILGTSGRAMLNAIIAGQDDPEHLADLAVGTARRKHSDLIDALRGCVTDHHRSRLKLHLELIQALESSLEQLDATLGIRLAPIQAHATRLTTMPGIADIAAQVMVAEIGVDMSRASPPRGTSSPGPVFVLETTRVPGNGDPRVCERARTGSKPLSSPPRGQPYARRIATFGPSSSASKPDGGPRKQSSPSLPPW